MTKLIFLLLLGVAAVIESSPARMYSSRRLRAAPRRDTVATVDCTNKEAVKYVLQSNANFRCVYPRWDQPSEYSGSLFAPGLQSASLTKESDDNCEPGFIFSPSVGLCLIAHRPVRPIIPLESDSLVAEPPVLELLSTQTGPNSDADCESGTMFNPELGICTEVPRRPIRPLSSMNLIRENRPVGPMEIRAFSGSVHTAADCRGDQIYAAELNLCMDRSIRPQFPLQSASLTRDVGNPRPRPSPFTSSTTCPEGQMFLSEVGACIPDRRTNKNPFPQVLSQVRPVQAPVAPRVAVMEKNECGQGEIFNPSIGICMPRNPSQSVPTLPPASSLVKEPVQLELQAFQNSVSSDECSKLGKIFNSEIGVCM